MSWEPEINEIRKCEELSKEMGGTERIGRQHQNGRNTVRERIEKFLDKGLFHETGT